jgi:hypothetical protein
VGVLLEEVVFDLPCEVDAELVGELDLRKRVLEQLQFLTVVPRPGKLVFIENTELHSSSSCGGNVAEPLANR